MSSEILPGVNGVAQTEMNGENSIAQLRAPGSGGGFSLIFEIHEKDAAQNNDDGKDGGDVSNSR